MDSHDEGPRRLSISRDALRADLAEMELRICRYLDGQLRNKADSTLVFELIARVDTKADAVHVHEIDSKLDALDRGDFTPVHRRALVELIETRTTERQAASWTWRERVMAVMSAVVTLASLLLSLVIAFHGGTT